MTTLMVVVALLSLAAAGFAVGVLCSEWRQRKEALDACKAAGAELSSLLQKINVAHNSLVEETKVVHDRLNKLELKLSVKGPK